MLLLYICHIGNAVLAFSQLQHPQPKVKKNPEFHFEDYWQTSSTTENTVYDGGSGGVKDNDGDLTHIWIHIE